MIVTIDGPAGAGKSTVARALARRLGFLYLDTGALYRGLTYMALERGIELDDPGAMAELAASLNFRFLDQAGGGAARLICEGRDISSEIRTPEVTRNIYHAADPPAVRRVLNRKQREFAAGHDLVTEGRDQGTEVFPEAEVKFYLDASPTVRARRRLADYAQSAQEAFELVRREIVERDERDRSRPVGALRKPEEAVLIDSSNMSPEEVIDAMEAVVRQRMRQSD